MPGTSWTFTVEPASWCPRGWQQVTAVCCEQEQLHCGFLNPQQLPSAFLDTVGGVITPSLTMHAQWSDTILRDFGNHVHRAMTDVTDAVQEGLGLTQLYTPHQDLSNMQTAARDQVCPGNATGRCPVLGRGLAVA